MRRRKFLKLSGGAALAGATSLGSGGSLGPATLAEVAETSTKDAPAVANTYNASDHRQRLENIAICERGIRKCLRRHLITNYLAGQCCYNLGEYPCRKVWDPDDWDEHELDNLKEQGISLIQVHEDWCDSQRLFGADKYSPLNPAGFHRFVEMVHRRGMKLIVYASSGFFDRRDPDFRKEWARDQDLIEIYYHYARCSPASPGWRAYLLPHLVKIMDEYGVDGLYDDLGYVPLAGNPQPPTADEVLAFEESDRDEGALGDLLGLICGEVKRRGGIFKVHHSGASRPRTELKVYDYLWVGEGGRNLDTLREAVKNHPPYVVPCPDMSRAKIENEDELYLQSIPYMQFPLLLAGRPFTGERALIPGIQYQPEANDFWTRHCRAIWRYYRAHPDGPYSYGWWDSVPGRPEARPTHARWLKQYLPVVEEGTWAWLEISESDFFPRPLPENVVASAFANRALYLVLANYGQEDVEVETSQTYSLAAGSPEAKRQWRLKARTLQILKPSGQA